jgi:hypothetical protein
MVVWVDRHAVAIQDLRASGGRYRATHWHDDGNGWAVELALGEPFGAPPDPGIVAQWQPGATVDHDGATWSVEELVR